jgi:nitrile hydratase
MLTSLPQNIVAKDARPMAERLITDIGGLPADEVPREEVPQLFWEKHMIAMFNVLWSRGIFNLDEFRRTVEETPPDEYIKSTFYGRRIDGMAKLLIEKGLIDPAELATRTQDILRNGTRDHAG